MSEYHSSAESDRGLVYTLYLLLIIMPVSWAFSHVITILIIESLSLFLIWRVSRDSSNYSSLNRVQMIFIAGGFLYLLINLLPVPLSVWAAIPGRGTYLEVLRVVPDEIVSSWRPMSLSSQLTFEALLLYIAYIGIFLSILSLSSRRIVQMLYIIGITAILQSVIGLVQYGGSIELVGSQIHQGVARGTYLNRDHLAGFLEMVFPILLGLIAINIGRHRAMHRPGNRFINMLQDNQLMVYLVAIALIILCLIFTRSRAGIFLTMLGLFLSIFAFSRRLGGNDVYGVYGTVLFVIVILAVEIGLLPVFHRFTIDPLDDMRWEIYSTSLTAIANFFPFGSGPGTFSLIYPAYQIPHHDFFINHVHNDYLEWLFEGGIFAAALIMLGIYIYLVQWKTVWKSERWHTFQFIQVGAGLGVLLMLLHTLIDFNLHKPVNVVYFVILLAVFFKQDTFVSR